MFPRHPIRRWPWCLALLLWVPAVAGCEEGAAGPCDGIRCSSHGQCVVTAGEAACDCDPGYEPEGLMCVDPTDPAPTTDQITQYGVAFTFSEPVRFGRYANGDYWVLGPVTVVRISPDFTGRHHGWEVNPADTSQQGFDGRIADFHAERVPALPYVAEPGESLVKTISLSPLSDADCRPCVKTAAVLTVVGQVPPGDGASVFRPPYFGDDKPEYDAEGLHLELLPTLEATGEPPTLAEVEDEFRRPQLDHKVNWTGRPLHPADAMPDYGSDIASRNAAGALRLMLDDAEADKRPAVIQYVQYGIDLYHMMLGGVTWPPGGGHGEGRKLPVTFAAVLLDEPVMQADVSESATPVFGENGGMYDAEPAGTVLFGQTWNSAESYWTNLVFDTGSRTIPDPYGYIDGGHRPGGSYQFCCTAMSWKAEAAALLLMPELRAVWNQELFFDYVFRWVRFGAWTQPDPCAPPTGVCAGGDNAGAACTTASEPDVCTGQDAACDTTGSWDTGYGVTYGDDGTGHCILDTDPSDGIGRFPRLHGASTDDGYHGSLWANTMWRAYVTLE